MKTYLKHTRRKRNVMGRNQRRRLASAAIGIACAAAAFVAFQRYTAFGIFGAGGGRYWVERAAAEENPDLARAHLRRVLGATQYGVNVAENAVRELPRPEDRIRLWRLLVEIAPNENWRGIYSRRLAAEGWEAGVSFRVEERTASSGAEE
jgi:hypothetical protein